MSTQIDSGCIECCVNEESDMWVLLESVHDWLVMPAKGEGGGVTVSAPGIGCFWQRIWQLVSETNPKFSVFKPKDEEEMDTSCFCCIHCMVFTLSTPVSLIMLQICVYQGTGVFIDGAWLGSNLAHNNLISGLCNTLSWAVEKSTFTLLNTF